MDYLGCFFLFISAVWFNLKTIPSILLAPLILKECFLKMEKIQSLVGDVVWINPAVTCVMLSDANRFLLNMKWPNYLVIVGCMFNHFTVLILWHLISQFHDVC